MQEVTGNIWDYHSSGRWIGITTNGSVRKDGACVMGRGIASEAAQKYPHLPYIVGSAILNSGNRVYVLNEYKIITIPVKHHWKETADLKLIEESIKQLVNWANNPYKHGKFYIPRAGCGNGKLDWENVKPIYEKYIDDRFVVVSL
jgi:hypothetical protein